MLRSRGWSVFLAVFAALLVPVFLEGWFWTAARLPSLDFMIVLMVLPVAYWILYFTRRDQLWARKALLVLALVTSVLGGFVLLGFFLLAMMMS